MTEPSKAVTDAIQSATTAPRRVRRATICREPGRRPIYAPIYGGGLIVYGALIVAFLL